MQGSGKEIGPKGKLITPGLPLSRRDRKKKRFVGQSGQEDKKKIKTESGRYISSSYKRDLYPTGRGRVGRGGFLSGSSYRWSGIQGAGPGPGVASWSFLDDASQLPEVEAETEN